MRTARAGVQAVALGVLLTALPGCDKKGSITFDIQAPTDGRLSPFIDKRYDFAAVSGFDVANPLAPPTPLGRFVTTFENSGTDIYTGEVNIGPGHTYDLQLQVLGGGQLLGMARTPGVEVLPLVQKTVVLAARKPLLFYMMWPQGLLGADPNTAGVKLPTMKNLPLLAMDPTIPRALDDERIEVSECDPRKLDSCPGASATTSDGKLLILALPGRILMIATDALYEPDSNTRTVAAATLTKVEGKPSNPLAREIVLNKDSSAFGIATDQGVVIGSVDAVRTGETPMLATIPILDAMERVVGVSSVAWAPDQKTLTALAGPTWKEVKDADCAPQPSFTRDITTDGSVGPIVPAPDSATDIGYPPDGVPRFAAPCGLGIVRREGTSPDIAGSNITQMLIVGDTLNAVLGKLEIVTTFDPDNPAIYVAKVQSRGPGAAGEVTRARFEVPAELTTFPGRGQPVLVRLAPRDITVYDLAVTPDGSRIAVASRVRYEAERYTFNEHFNDEPDPPIRDAWCELSVVRDVYRMSVIDADREAGAGASVRTPPLVVGSEETGKCGFLCFDCNPQGMDCRKTTYPACSVIDGFIPSGMSLTFGSY